MTNEIWWIHTKYLNFKVSTHLKEEVNVLDDPFNLDNSDAKFVGTRMFLISILTFTREIEIFSFFKIYINFVFIIYSLVIHKIRSPNQTILIFR